MIEITVPAYEFDTLLPDVKSDVICNIVEEIIEAMLRENPGMAITYTGIYSRFKDQIEEEARAYYYTASGYRLHRKE